MFSYVIFIRSNRVRTYVPGIMKIQKMSSGVSALRRPMAFRHGKIIDESARVHGIINTTSKLINLGETMNRS